MTMAGDIIRWSCFSKEFTRRYLRCHRRNIHSNAACLCQQNQDSDKGDDIPTIMELRKRFMKFRGMKLGFDPVKKDHSYLLQYLPKTQEELPPRNVMSTLQRAIIPLSKDPQLEEKYLSTMGTRVRYGRLMEDLDMFSDFMSMSYIRNPKQPADEISAYVFVTVTVDHITFTDYIPKLGKDIRISGYVSSVGKTSVEVSVWMDQNDDGVYHKITKAIFIMAARNAILSGGAFVNPLVPIDDEEKLIVKKGEERRRKRSARGQESSLVNRPSPEEQEIVYKQFLGSIDKNLAVRVLPPDSVWMADTRRNNHIFSFTEDRNFQGTVFGGFLMRHALEMAWFTAYFHGQHQCILRHISDIHFRHPVPLGAVISFHGYVVYTEGKLMEVFVHGDVSDPSMTGTITSTVFYFTYEASVPIKSVLPNTYYEAMMYIDGRRHFNELMNRRKYNWQS